MGYEIWDMGYGCFVLGIREYLAADAVLRRPPGDCSNSGWVWMQLLVLRMGFFIKVPLALQSWVLVIW